MENTIVQNNKLLDALEGTLKKLSHGDNKVEYGFLRGTSSDVINAAVANNYGTRYISRSPFYDKAVELTNEDWKEYLKKNHRAITTGKIKPSDMFKKQGQIGVANIKNQIQAFGLIDTGKMYNSVSYKVNK